VAAACGYMHYMHHMWQQMSASSANAMHMPGPCAQRLHAGQGGPCQRAQAPELVLLQRLPGVVVLVLALEGRQVSGLLALLRVPAPATPGCCGKGPSALRQAGVTLFTVASCAAAAGSRLYQCKPWIANERERQSHPAC
jgi:hypothetical protein